jgi:exopolyphosphatase/guanosine-5'-triphosphate,3'-diphosphate pyrophosphatase
MARLGAIDIGSNAIRLRIVDVDPPDLGVSARGPRFRPFREVFADRVAVRLGHDVFTRGRIESSMIAQACDALRSFRTKMDEVKVDRYRAVATSACREAENADVFVERAEREAGVFVEVIEGVEEARLVQIAVRERMNLEKKTALLIDIGGGSTEVTIMRDLEPVVARSLPMGTVRLLEAFLDGGDRLDAVREELLSEYIERIAGEALRELSATLDGGLDMVIATGGNIETLADLAPLHQAFPESRGIDVAAMRTLLRELAAQTLVERVARYSLRPDRADTIVPAAKILDFAARAVNVDRILAPGVGLKEGVLVDLAMQHFVPRDFSSEKASVGEACLRLGRRYHFDESHGRKVASFATKLFDDLVKVHGLEPRDRVLLFAAALLHDVGDFVRYEGHHKHSYYVIAHSDIMGLTPAEREVVANVARYHRKSPPSLDHENFRALAPRLRTKVKTMASILRVADAFDREHRQVVSKISANVEGNLLWLTVEGDGERALEEWTVRAKSGLLRDTLGLELRLVNGSGPAPPSSWRVREELR